MAPTPSAALAPSARPTLRRVRTTGALCLAVAASAAPSAGAQVPDLPGVSPPSVNVPSAPQPVQDVVDGTRRTVDGIGGSVPPSVSVPSLPSGGGGGGGGGAGSGAPEFSSGGGGAGSTGPVGGGVLQLGPPSADGGARGAARGGRRSGRGGRRGASRSRGRGGASRAASARRRSRGAGAIGRGASASGGDTLLPSAVQRVIEVIPWPLKLALAVLALVALAAGIRSWVAGRRARRLGAQREELLEDVGSLQAALLPEVPARLGGLQITVAYRPADGPGAGGDFYGAFSLDGDRVGLIVGDVSGHGREALSHTSLLHYTLRAYLEAGLEPRQALRLAGEALEDDLGDDYATVVVATHDQRTGTLTYALAGHSPPILLGPPEHAPVMPFAAPPVGMPMPTGRRQTTVKLPPGSRACFYTDGLVEARVGGELLGRERLRALVAELAADASAADLLDRLRAVSDEVDDDTAACIVSPAGRSSESNGADPKARVEELELEARELGRPDLARFLEACGLPDEEIPAVIESAKHEAAATGAVVLRVTTGPGAVEWEVQPAETANPLRPGAAREPA